MCSCIRVETNLPVWPMYDSAQQRGISETPLAFGLPATRRAYYEGSVSYCDAAQLHEVFNNIKKNLRTDGAGWRQPVLANGTLHLPPLHIGPKSEENACATLITTCESASCPREGHTPMEGTSSPPRPIEVPMPYMDDVNRPGSIALPFKEKTLYSLRSKASSDILVRYYLTAIHCLGQTGDNPGDCSLANPRIVHFNKLFSSWIKTMVLPHLDEDNWYPGFGSVLRILETTTGGIEEEEPEEEPSEGEEVEEQKGLSTTAFYIIVGVGALIALWLIICCVCLFLNFRRKPRKVSQYGQSTTTTSSSFSASSLDQPANLWFLGKSKPSSGKTTLEPHQYTYSPHERSRAEKVQDEIIEFNSLIEHEDDELPVSEVQRSFEELLFFARGKFHELTSQLPSSADARPACRETLNCLPRLTVPMFSGKIEEWDGFFSVYSATIDQNSALSDAEKFIHLRGHSRFENYRLALDKLLDRYQNKNSLANFYTSFVGRAIYVIIPSYMNTLRKRRELDLLGKEQPHPTAVTYSCSVTTPCNSHSVLLGTAQILGADHAGNFHPIRTVIDCGSQVTIIQHNLVKKLKLKLQDSAPNVVGISGSDTSPIATVSCKLRSRFNSQKILTSRAVVLPRISAQLPSSELPQRFREIEDTSPALPPAVNPEENECSKGLPSELEWFSTPPLLISMAFRSMFDFQRVQSSNLTSVRSYQSFKLIESHYAPIFTSIPIPPSCWLGY
ncbi:hypothetical protein AAG570_006562 [Ranatra chinensis]|uniref:Peptidase A2 domain-containing protein n=1 Tax=Ranatra chinensis TaxID=642074 RepID=A0ABD0YUD0_9HEMI